MPFKDRLEGNSYRREYARQNPERVKNWHWKRYTPEGKKKRADWARADQKKYPDKYRDRSFRHKYGITLTDYNAMLEAQKSLCAICAASPKSEKPHHRLHVDHSHETGVVRGLLCLSCNVAVGYLEHLDLQLRIKAETYLAHALSLLTPAR